MTVAATAGASKSEAETMHSHARGQRTDEAYVTLVTNDAYVVGALVLGHSLRASGTDRRLICMTTAVPDGTPGHPHNHDGDGPSGARGPCPSSIAALQSVYDAVVPVPLLDSRDTARLRLLRRPELGPTFSKIAVWSLPDIRKAVFLDADMLVLRNMDDLFERPELSACPDIGWPDCFNSGLFVCEPHGQTFARLLEHALKYGSFDGGDQGLLNSFFADWSTSPDPRRRIPFPYNLTFSGSYGYAPALLHFRQSVRAVHFIGPAKPWIYHRDARSGRVIGRPDVAGMPAGSLLLDYVSAWWAVHDEHVAPLLESMSGQGKPLPTFATLYNSYTRSGHGLAAKPVPPMCLYGPGHGQKSPSVDCDLAAYRVKWAAEVEEYFSGRAAGGAHASPGERGGASSPPTNGGGVRRLRPVSPLLSLHGDKPLPRTLAEHDWLGDGEEADAVEIHRELAKMRGRLAQTRL